MSQSRPEIGDAWSQIMVVIIILSVAVFFATIIAALGQHYREHERLPNLIDVDQSRSPPWRPLSPVGVALFYDSLISERPV